MPAHPSKSSALLQELRAALAELEIAAKEYRTRQQNRKQQKPQTGLEPGKIEVTPEGSMPHVSQPKPPEVGRTNMKRPFPRVEPSVQPRGKKKGLLNVFRRIWFRLRRKR